MNFYYSIQKSEKMYIDEQFFSQKIPEELCVMKLIGVVKFKEKVITDLENNKEFVNSDAIS